MTTSNSTLRPKKLEYKNINSVGKQIYADFGTNFNMVEYTTTQHPQLIASEPWVQFEPEIWDTALDQIFEEMVDLWNEKYSS